MGVAVGPGAILLTVIPYCDKDLASPSVSPLNPHLLSVYAESAGLKLDADEILRIFPFILFLLSTFQIIVIKKRHF